MKLPMQHKVRIFQDIHKKCTAQTSVQVYRFRKAQLAVFACSHNLLLKSQKVHCNGVVAVANSNRFRLL